MKSIPSKIGRLLLLLVALSLSLGVHAQMDSVAQAERHEFSLQEAIDYADKHNVQVKNALLDVQVQEQTNREVTGSAYPQLSGNGSMTYNAKLPVSLVPAEFFGGQPGTFEKLVFGVKWNATGGVSLNQILFDGQVFTGLRARTALIDFQQKNLELTRENIRANIYKIYYQLSVSKTQVDLLDANISRLEKLEHDTKIMYDNGFAEKLDLDKLSVQLVNLQSEKTNATAQISNGYLGLKTLMGMPIRDELVLTDSITENEVKEGILDAYNFKYDDRRDYQVSELGIQLKEFDVQRYKLAKLPRVTLNGYFNENAQRNKFDFFQGGDWFGISAFTLNINIPIFQGFSANARIARANISLQQSINQQEALKINIDNEINTALNNYKAAIENLDFQRRNMQLAEEVYNQTKKKFEIGTGSQLEITNSQTDLKSAQTSYINSLYNAIIAKVDFMKATGKL